MRTVEDADHPFAGHLLVDPPQVIVRQLLGGRLLEAGDSDTLRVKRAEHPANRAVLATRVQRLEDDLATLKPEGMWPGERAEELLCRHCYILALLDELFRAGLQIKSPLYTLDQSSSVDDLLSDAWREGDLKDSCFQHLDAVRMSPAFWKKFKKDVFAMLRQFGSPQFFISISCAEHRWIEIMAQIGGTTVKEVSEMSWSERNLIIQKNPHQYARMFLNRINLLFNNEVPVHKNGFLGHVFHRIWRYEFQKRGSFIFLFESTDYS